MPPNIELSGRQRQAAARRPVIMYRVPPAGARWPAVGAPLERQVGHRCAVVGERGNFAISCGHAAKGSRSALLSVAKLNFKWPFDDCQIRSLLMRQWRRDSLIAERCFQSC